ncbi:hypothetical protein K6W17_08195 [Burkholderia dolosa]|uniref:Gp46 n=2 Tax=Burkholderia TaxID=32008 RepID=B9BQI8_9BURK|nr:gp46 [Burkholderia multivorans CGD2]EEE13173.1 gp46 [Burkholderia multivorans CGD2M]MBY4752015.1 hypothetical protein [Burkholderia dolosa]
MFVKRSIFGPWIEVDKPEPGVVRLYFGPPPLVPASAPVGLTDEQRSTLESLARTSTPYEQEVLRSILAAHPGQPEPIAWESTTVAYTKYITDERYQKFSPEVRKWYKPYRCSACSEPRAMLTVDESNLLARINDATKPVDVADRHAVIKLVERLAVFALMPEIPCE